MLLLVVAVIIFHVPEKHATMAIVANAIRNLCEFAQDLQTLDSPNWIWIKRNLIIYAQRTGAHSFAFGQSRTQPKSI